jgi:hypothetical protein
VSADNNWTIGWGGGNVGVSVCQLTEIGWGDGNVGAGVKFYTYACILCTLQYKRTYIMNHLTTELH